VGYPQRGKNPETFAKATLIVKIPQFSRKVKFRRGESPEMPFLGEYLETLGAKG